jgi:hypothetical protein
MKSIKTKTAVALCATAVLVNFKKLFKSNEREFPRCISLVSSVYFALQGVSFCWRAGVFVRQM